MPRRKKCRWVSLELPNKIKGEIEITADELEAIRLADVEGLSQVEAAELMGISQPTFHRILKEARRKVGRALIEGLRIRVVGGDHIMRRFRCFDCGYEWEEPFGTGRPEACPKCGSPNFCRVDAGRGRGRGRGGGGGRGRGWCGGRNI